MDEDRQRYDRSDAAATGTRAAKGEDSRREDRDGIKHAGGVDHTGVVTKESPSIVATLSHEIRIPLNTIIGFADMMENETYGPLGDPRYRGYAADIRQAGRSVLEILNDLLEGERFANAAAGDIDDFRRIVDLAPDLICICRDGQIERINPAGVSMLAASHQDQIVGRPFLDFVHQKSREVTVGSIDDLMTTQTRLPLRLVRTDSIEIEVEVAALPYPFDDDAGDGQGIIVIARDVTERNRAQRALAAREQHIRKVMDTVVDGIVTIDENGTIDTLNPAAERIFGYDSGELLGRSCACLVAHAGAEKEVVDYMLGAAEAPTDGTWAEADGSELVREVRGQRRDGSEFPLEVAFSPLKLGRRRYAIGVLRDITARKRNEERLEFMATRHPLTHLPNRNLFQDRLERTMLRADHDGSQLAVLFIDIDQFKNINEAFGHRTGDRVLQMAGERLLGCAGEDSLVAHIASDEFKVLIDRVESEEQVHDVAQRMLTTMAAPFYVDGREIYTSVSIGIVLYPKNAATLHDVERNVDTATNYAKRLGRANIQFYNGSLSDEVQRRFEIANRLRRAIEEDEFHVLYQPKVNLSDRRVVGCEALIRWDHSPLGPISPAEFIPVAEETGLIVPIGEWVLHEACTAAARWRQDHGMELKVAVNLSAYQFVRGDLVDTVRNVLDDTGLPAELLDLELTESMLAQNAERTIQILAELKTMGITTSMDDFGTGYSSLSYLTRFPLDSLKVDRSFVANLPGEKDAVTVVRAIVSMARNLNLQIIAEGLETEAQVGFLHALGCETGQGYLFSPPVENQRFIELTRAANGIA